MQEEKRKIYLTGKCVEDLAKEECEVSCYLCKRPGGAESIYNEDGVVRTADAKSDLSWYVAKTESIDFHYLLCVECFILLNSFCSDGGDLIDEKPDTTSRNLN